MHKYFIWVFVVVFILGIAGAVYVFYPQAGVPQGVACTMEAKMCPDGSAVGRSGPQCEFSECPTPTYTWIVSDAGTNASGVPHTNASLRIGNKEYPLGVFEGSCAEIDGTIWQYAPNEKAGLVCWFAGGGVELGVFEENGALFLKKGLVDEGTAETAGTRGPFEVIKELGSI